MAVSATTVLALAALVLAWVCWCRYRDSTESSGGIEGYSDQDALVFQAYVKVHDDYPSSVTMDHYRYIAETDGIDTVEGMMSRMVADLETEDDEDQEEGLSVTVSERSVYSSAASR